MPAGEVSDQNACRLRLRKPVDVPQKRRWKKPGAAALAKPQAAESGPGRRQARHAILRPRTYVAARPPWSRESGDARATATAGHSPASTDTPSTTPTPLETIPHGTLIAGR
jgi:hypothetical protein